MGWLPCPSTWWLHWLYMCVSVLIYSMDAHTDLSRGVGGTCECPWGSPGSLLACVVPSLWACRHSGCSWTASLSSTVCPCAQSGRRGEAAGCQSKPVCKNPQKTINAYLLHKTEKQISTIYQTVTDKILYSNHLNFILKEFLKQINMLINCGRMKRRK